MNLVVDKNCDEPSRGTICKKVVFVGFRKSAVRILMFSLEIMKGHSKIILRVIFHIDGDFNNSRE